MEKSRKKAKKCESRPEKTEKEMKEKLTMAPW